jgi:hypothetical protein
LDALLEWFGSLTAPVISAAAAAQERVFPLDDAGREQVVVSWRYDGDRAVPFVTIAVDAPEYFWVIAYTMRELNPSSTYVNASGRPFTPPPPFLQVIAMPLGLRVVAEASIITLERAALHCARCECAAASHADVRADWRVAVYDAPARAHLVCGRCARAGA